MNQQPIDRIDEIAEKAGEKLRVAILELRDKINEAINVIVEDAQDAAEKTEKGRRAVLSIPATIKWDLDKMHVGLDASVTVKHKSEQEFQLDDPNQPPLPLDADGDKVSKNVADAVGKIIQTVRDAGATVTVGRRLE